MRGSPGFVDEVEHRPLYARALRVRHLAPSGLLCFVFLEGAIALGILLALAELVSWWGVIVLPITVAAMVKLNDVIAGSLVRAATPTRPPMPPGGTSAVAARRSAVPRQVGEESTRRLPGMVRPGSQAMRPSADRLEAQVQWARQSATRRYE